MSFIPCEVVSNESSALHGCCHRSCLSNKKRSRHANIPFPGFFELSNYDSDRFSREMFCKKYMMESTEWSAVMQCFSRLM